MTHILAVVGMHRSGTSALAGVLVRAGAWFGDPALAAGGRPARPLGLVERKDFLALSEPALMALGLGWDNVFGFSRAWPEPFAQSLREKFRRGALADLLAHEVSVLKDPRLCFVLPLFLPELRRVTGVMIVRNPVEVAMSLAARNGFPMELGVALWEAYNRQALISLAGVPSIVVQHRELMRRPDAAIPDIIRRLSDRGVPGLDPQPPLSAASIDRTLHHQHARGMKAFELSRAQKAFWRSLREAQTPDQVGVGELSRESAAVLKARHAAASAQSRKPRPAS